MKEVNGVEWMETGAGYHTFVENMQQRLEETDPESLAGADKTRFSYLPMNLQRMRRIYKTYNVLEKIRNILGKINSPQTWMVITEDWCGDSAQSLPIIARFSECNPNISLKIIPRDENPEIMNRYLTRGKRSIPKLVVFNERGNELFRWGPRPAEAQALFERLEKEGIERPQILKELHLWYGKNRGKAVEEEFFKLLSGTL
ncbi:MAG: thioredoxin family protein [Calditrichia bacterium]